MSLSLLSFESFSVVFKFNDCFSSSLGDGGLSLSFLDLEDLCLELDS